MPRIRPTRNLSFLTIRARLDLFGPMACHMRLRKKPVLGIYVLDACFDRFTLKQSHKWEFRVILPLHLCSTSISCLSFLELDVRHFCCFNMGSAKSTTNYIKEPPQRPPPQQFLPRSWSFTTRPTFPSTTISFHLRAPTCNSTSQTTVLAFAFVSLCCYFRGCHQRQSRTRHTLSCPTPSLLGPPVPPASIKRPSRVPIQATARVLPHLC